MKKIIGIDVGMTGALAFYDGQELLIYDMPTTERNKTNRVDCKEFKRILDCYVDYHTAYVELVNAFGMGASSAYNFGWSCGVVEAMLHSNGIDIVYVQPRKWKSVLQVPTDKEDARQKASVLLPEFAHNWDRKKYHNRAEAALIALYGYKLGREK